MYDNSAGASTCLQNQRVEDSLVHSGCDTSCMHMPKTRNCCTKENEHAREGRQTFPELGEIRRVSPIQHTDPFRTTFLLRPGHGVFFFFAWWRSYRRCPSPCRCRVLIPLHLMRLSYSCLDLLRPMPFSATRLLSSAPALMGCPQDLGVESHVTTAC